MSLPATPKKIHKLTGRLANLNRFISRCTDKCQIFFKVIREALVLSKTWSKVWSLECQEDFDNIKISMQKPPILTSPKPDEPVGVYLVVSKIAISLVLFTISTEQSIHFLSKKLTGGEPNYTKLEN